MTPARLAMRVACAVSLALAAVASPARAQERARGPLPYRDPTRSTEDRVQDLLARMTIEEKFWQMFMLPGDLDNPAHDYSHGAYGLQIDPKDASGVGAAAAMAHARRINDIQRFFVERTRLGIPVIPFEEALHGLTREGATVFPQAIGLAAAWDTSLMERVATAIARETRSRGIRQVLSPVVNVASDVRWGRVEETYGEDPFLAARMGVSFAAPFEHAGVVTTAKHFVANVGEGGRDSYPIDWSERRLEEYFLPPFKDLLHVAGARSVMSAYNSVDGIPATQNRRLLTDKLRREWGFTGVVISDAAATSGSTVLHFTDSSTAAAAKRAIESGLDVIFQTSWEQHRPYLAAFQSGIIDVAAIDTAVARVLRLKIALGLFEHPYVDPGVAAPGADPAHRSLALEAARASLVLLRNERNVLPLRSSASIALIGVDADEARLGGYSGPATGAVSICEGLIRRFGPSRVRYAPGPGRDSHEFEVVPTASLSMAGPSPERGLRGEYFDNNRLDGTPRVVRVDGAIDFHWTLSAPAPGLATDWYSVRWTGRLTAPPGGVRRLGIEGNDGYRLWIDGALVVDNWRKVSYGVRMADVRLAQGSVHDVRIEYFESTGNARVRLVWEAGAGDAWQRRIAAAVALVRQSDVAVITVGIEEGEFRDRASLALPGHQEALITRVASVGKPVVVIVVGGSAVTGWRWMSRVGAVLQAWYPGVEGGTAIAEVLAGDVNPSGRLPITVPMAEGQLPLVYNHTPTGRGDDYVDLTGQPLFPFGHGLSYTRFEYSALRIDAGDVLGGVPATVGCRITNAGARAGDEVVQLYLRDLMASVARPVMQLAGFRRIRLAPGESADVSFTVPRERLQLLNERGQWVVEPGIFRVLIGASSKDIRLRGELMVR
jgi:beta-glucosidase